MVSNTHHLFFPAKDYASGLERRFRNLKCMTVELDFEAHRLLHWMSQPPKKPTPTQMREAIDRHKHRECSCPN